jgi:hypothetical protein
MEPDTTPVGRGCGIMAGVTLIVVGALLLAAQYLDLEVWGWVAELPWDYAWTVFVIAPGVVMFVYGVVVGKELVGLAIPGSIVTTVGVILLYSAFSGAWQIWAYVWALIPASVGFGMSVMAIRTMNPGLRRVGNAFIGISLVVFVVLAVFFEVFVGIGGVFTDEARRAVLPALVIVAGLFIVFSSLRSRGSGSGATAPGTAAPPTDLSPAEPADPLRRD